VEVSRSANADAWRQNAHAPQDTQPQDAGPRRKLQEVYAALSVSAITIRFDAVVVAAAIGGLIVLGIAPFDPSNSSSSVTTLAVSVLIVLLLAAVAIFKGRLFFGLIGIFIPLVSLVGACRLASPSSPWARRFYAAGGHKLAEAQVRYERINARRKRLEDAIAGAPSAPPS